MLLSIVWCFIAQWEKIQNSFNIIFEKICGPLHCDTEAAIKQPTNCFQLQFTKWAGDINVLIFAFIKLFIGRALAKTLLILLKGFIVNLSLL